MEKETLILAAEFCAHHKIEISFIHSLKESGLIDYTIVEEDVFIPQNQLIQLEKLKHLHYDLEINLQGLETITHLLEQMQLMQQEITNLQNRLSFYEA